MTDGRKNYSTCSSDTESPWENSQNVSCFIAVRNLASCHGLKPIKCADGVSEGEFEATLTEELPKIRGMHAFPFPRDLPVNTPPRYTDACAELGFNPTITLIVVGKEHKFVFFPEASVAEGGQPPRNPNCPPGTVIDTVVTSPVEWDFYLCSHQGILGTSKPAHYNVLLDENNFTYAAQPSPFLFSPILICYVGLMVFNHSRTLSATSTRAAHAPSLYPHRSTVSSTGAHSPPVCVLMISTRRT